jgi:hypothetical protein
VSIRKRKSDDPFPNHKEQGRTTVVMGSKKMKSENKMDVILRIGSGHFIQQMSDDRIWPAAITKV